MLVDNDMQVVILPSGSSSSADYRSIPARAESTGGQLPEKRSGHTAAVIGERIFVFGGRGGKELRPLEENGRVWIFNTRTDTWSFLDPMPGTPYPAARYHHSSVALEKPEFKKPSVEKANPARETPRIGSIAAGVKTDDMEGGHGTFFVHAGCPVGGRTNDLWGFDVRSRTWKEYPPAPGKPRGGAAICISKNRIYRYGGYNGEGEEGGQLDILELGLDTFADKGGFGEATVTTKGGWQTLNFAEENMTCPGNRSVAGLHTINTGMGREYLVLVLGERAPTSQGHDGGGKFWGDVWAFVPPPQGMSGASFKDATWQALGRETGEGLWSLVGVARADGRDGDDVRDLFPNERGWFASSAMGDLDVSGIVLWGGLSGKNESEDNGWILKLD